jgi:hypothetical protein
VLDGRPLMELARDLMGRAPTDESRPGRVAR